MQNLPPERQTDIWHEFTEDHNCISTPAFLSEKIREQAAVIRTYVFEAIEVEKAGLKVEYKKTTEYEIPKEFRLALNANTGLKEAFEALTPGRQRGTCYIFPGPSDQERVNRVTADVYQGF